MLFITIFRHVFWAWSSVRFPTFSHKAKGLDVQISVV